MISPKQASRKAKKLFRLCQVNELLDENRARRVVHYVAHAGRRDCPAVLAQFLRLVRLDRARHTTNIESAAPLPPELLTSIQSGMARRFGPGLITEVALRPSLIGGVRIQVGSNVYDASVQAGLAAMEKSF